MTMNPQPSPALTQGPGSRSPDYFAPGFSLQVSFPAFSFVMFQLIVALAETEKPLDRKHPGSLGRRTTGGVLTAQNDAVGQGGSEEQPCIGHWFRFYTVPPRVLPSLTEGILLPFSQPADPGER